MPDTCGTCPTSGQCVHPSEWLFDAKKSENKLVPHCLLPNSPHLPYITSMAYGICMPVWKVTVYGTWQTDIILDTSAKLVNVRYWKCFMHLFTTLFLKTFILFQIIPVSLRRFIRLSSCFCFLRACWVHRLFFSTHLETSLTPKPNIDTHSFQHWNTF